MKKIIAVLTVISIVFAFSACSSKKYKETEATVPVTNAQGETVTNSNGEVLTEVVTKDGETTVVSSSQNDISSTSTVAGASTKTSTTKKASKKTDKSSSASKVETTKKGSSSSSVKTTKKADKSSGEQTSKASQPATKKNGTTATTKKTDTSSTTKKEDSASTTKKDTTTTAKPTTAKPTTTEKPKKRDIKVKVVLPFYNDEQATVKISYKLEGKEKPESVMFADPENPKKEIDTKAVKLNGKSTVDCTIKNVKGDVEIIVQLKDFSGKDNIKNNKVTVKSNETEVTISPLTGIGMVNGDDESLD